MGVIGDLNFLKKDKRFYSILESSDKKRLGWYIKFDTYLRAEIKKLIKYTKSGYLNAVHTLLVQIQISIEREVYFLGRMLTVSRLNNLDAEAGVLKETILLLNKVRSATMDAGRLLGTGKKDEVIALLKDSYKLD